MSLRRCATQAVKPLVPRPLLAALKRKRFFDANSWQNLHWGVFRSFDEANSFAQKHGRAPHFDMDQRKWLAEHLELAPHDYPVLYWLERLLCSAEGQQFARLADLGGSVGTTYLTLKPYLSLPPRLVWQVCELPEVVEFGRQVARERGLQEHLAFSADAKATLEGADILYTAGAIQYIEGLLEQTLAGLAHAPRHVFVNRLPLTQHPDFVTLQNSGVAVHPYHIRNDAAFVAAMAGIGYHLVDRWKCLQNSTHIPLHPERTLEHFHGFYFRREGEG
jgi:putative methyltransferase (TIGR04325 family)